MEFRSPDDGSGYNPPPPIRVSAFSKPTLSPSSSFLLSPRGVGGSQASGSTRNGNCFEPPLSSSTASPTPTMHPLQARGTTGSTSFAPSSAPISSSGATGTAVGVSESQPNLSAATTTATYHECLHNHAASIGGYVLDGCGEFMPGGGGDAGAADAMKCAACGCHRSFHRRDSDEDNYRLSNSVRGGLTPLLLPPPQPDPQQQHHRKQLPSSPLGAGVPGSSATESSSEERNVGGCEIAPQQQLFGSKKRFRTKFTAEQKEQMLRFAERVGWRMQRQDDAAVEQFCAEIGVKRQVLKVWMHNNKHTIRRRQQQQEQQ